MKKRYGIAISLLLGAFLVAQTLFTTTDKCNLADGTAGTIIDIEMGDWSCDGHCLSKSRNICSNRSLEQLKAGYQAAKEKILFDFREEVASDFEDSVLKIDKLKVLREHGIATWKFEEESAGQTVEQVTLDTDAYSEIYLLLVKLGAPDFKFETLSGKSLHIGGYGLFSP